MKKISKRNILYYSIIIGFFAIVNLLMLLVLNNKLLGAYEAYNVWSLAKNKFSFGENNYGLGLIIGYYASFLPILSSFIFAIRKKPKGLFIPIIYLLLYEFAFMLFHFLYNVLSLQSLIALIIGIVLVLVSIGLLVRLIYLNKDNVEAEENDKEKRIKKYSIQILVLDIIGIILLFSTFLIPVYAVRVSDSDPIKFVILFNVLFAQSKSILESVVYLVNFALLLGSVITFSITISSFFSSKKIFVKNSKVLITYNLFYTIVFFLIGYGAKFYYVLSDKVAYTYSFIPLIIICMTMIGYGILSGKFNKDSDATPKKMKHRILKIEPLLYVLALTAVTYLALFLKVIKVNVMYGNFQDKVDLTGWDLLKDYGTLGSGYQILAFIIIVMMISSAVGLALSLASYFAKNKSFPRIAKTVCYVNFFFVFIIGISGLYFAIVREINIDQLEKLLELKGLEITESYKYSITTDTVYALAIDVIVLMFMYIRKLYDKNPEGVASNEELESNNANGINNTAKIDEKKEVVSFDPCPSFTELDSKIPEYKKDLALREASKVKNPTLNSLVNFIVEYARDSRLHLSYSKEDIATFISGLGACRLTILQGMSGTGKTSLPKIFSEAVYGKCEIIEVESSWKDKNELLGYYNEFSKKYTPKKFTQALYRAALNKEIPTFIVLDEMNLSRIEYYFSDFLSLMENEEDKREIKLLNIKISRNEDGVESEYKALTEGHTLKVPTNVWFIGTANRDESTFVISDKVYDRAHTMNFNKRAPKVRDYKDPIPQRFYTYEQINEMLNAAKKSGTFDAENNQIIRNVETILSPFNISFGNRILKQIEDFVNIYQACFPNENVLDNAIETILLSKVVSKLEVKIIDNKEKLQEEFENLNLNKCAEFISKLNED